MWKADTKFQRKKDLNKSLYLLESKKISHRKDYLGGRRESGGKMVTPLYLFKVALP